MTLETDLAMIAEQERRLCFAALDVEQLWQLGADLRRRALARGLALAIEIRLAGDTVFFSRMPGASPNNADWARRKRNAVEMLHASSYAVGLAAQQKGASLERESGQPLRDYAIHGGSFPLRLAGLGVVGAVTVSGAPEREDHALVVEALAHLLGVSLAGLTLDSIDQTVEQ